MLYTKDVTLNELKEATKIESSRKLFAQGLITQLSNPKAIIFFTALLPQFITEGDNITAQFMILGVTSIAVEFPVLALYGWLAEQGKRLVFNGRFAALPDRIA